MTPSSRRWLRTALWGLAAWLLFGVLLGQQVYVLQAGQGSLGIWSHAIALQVDYALVWALVTPAVLAVGRAFPLFSPASTSRRVLWRALPVHLVASVACSIAVQATHAFTVSRLYPGWFPRPSSSDVERSLMASLDYNVILYGVTTLLGQSFSYLRTLNAERVRQAELREQLAGAQLQALRMQMHPHFLFNALNSVAELIHEDPEAAERTVTGLGDLLRVYLRSSEAQEIPLAQEVEFLQQYLAIQKLRFEERLAVRIRLDPGTESAIVPSLILQPLVENAILHGLSDREQDGVIAIDASLQGGSLALRVSDNGAGQAAVVRPVVVEGHGLGNTRRRLERLYGGEHDFSMSAVSGGGTCASIRIPLRRSSGGREAGPCAR